MLGHMMRRVDSLENTLRVGEIEGRRIKGRQRMRWLDGITDSKEYVWVNTVRYISFTTDMMQPQKGMKLCLILYHEWM